MPDNGRIETGSAPEGVNNPNETGSANNPNETGLVDNNRSGLSRTVEEGIGAGEDPREVLKLVAEGITSELDRNEKGKRLRLAISSSDKLDEFLKSDDPRKKAIALDLKKALSERDLALVNTYQEEGQITPKEAEKHRILIKQEINRINEERQALIGEKGITEENQVKKVAQMLAGNEEEQKVAQSDPLGSLEDKLNKAMRSKGERDVFFNMLRDKLGVDDKTISHLEEEMSDILRTEQKQGLKNMLNKGKSLAFLMTLLSFLLAYVARKDDQQGG